MTSDPDLVRLCPGCFADKGAANPCPHCGFDEQAPRPAQALALRTLLKGRFVIGRVLGKPGGFGITYLGWDRQLQTRVAIKEYLPRDLAVRAPDGSSILPHTAEEDGLFRYGLDQFLAEARTLARMDHPNIVRVRHFFEANRSAYLVMDYYRGLSLAEHLERSEQRGGPERLGERNALTLMLPILDGLRAVHAKGFLHRDVKPQNIYLARTDSGGVRPILLDFGAARQAVGERSRSLSVVVSPGYAPFEQYHRKGAQGPPTDIYGAAAVLYRMVTGETPPEATERMADDTLRPAAAFGVSQAVSAAIGQGMAMSPAARPQTVQAFQAKLLGTGAASMPASAPASVSSAPPPGPAPVHPAARPALPALPAVQNPCVPPAGPVSAKRRWFGAVVMGLMLLGLGGWYQYHQGQIEAQLRKAADDRAFETALWTNTDVAYRAYLDACAAHGCAHRVAAEQRLVGLTRREVADDRAFDSAQKEDTDSAFRTYLSTCATNGCGHQLAAEQRLSELETERRMSADDRALEVARIAGTQEAYRGYLDACAADGCGHREEAERQLGKLKEEAEREARTKQERVAKEALQQNHKAAEKGDADAQPWQSCLESVHRWMSSQGDCGASNCFNEHGSLEQNVVKRCGYPKHTKKEIAEIVALAKSTCRIKDNRAEMSSILESHLAFFPPTHSIHRAVLNECFKNK